MLSQQCVSHHVHGYQHTLNYIEYMTLIWATLQPFTTIEYQSLSAHVCEVFRGMTDMLDRLFTERYKVLLFILYVCTTLTFVITTKVSMCNSLTHMPAADVEDRLACDVANCMSQLRHANVDKSQTKRPLTDAEPVLPHWNEDDIINMLGEQKTRICGTDVWKLQNTRCCVV